MSDAVRQHRRRRRERQGRCVVLVELDPVDVGEWLARRGYLPPAAMDDRDMIGAALARWLETVTRDAMADQDVIAA